MRSISKTTVAVAGLAALALGAGSLATASDEPATGPDRLSTFFQVTGFVPVDVNGDGKASDGDTFVVRGDHYNRQGGKKIGSGTSVCTVVDTAAGLSDCQGSDTLPGGEIRSAGQLVQGATGFRWAIVGGTGRYRTAHGQLVGTNLNPDGSQIEAVYKIID
jgi:hypothetical protein